MCHTFMVKFLKMLVTEAAGTVYKLRNIPVLHAKNHKPASGVDVGLASKAHLMVKK